MARASKRGAMPWTLRSLVRGFHESAGLPAERARRIPWRGQAREARAGDEAVARGVGGIVAIHFANIFDAALVADQLRQAFDEPGAIFRDEPGIAFEQLIHQLPAADAVVVRSARARQSAKRQDFAELFGDGRFRSAMRESIRREKHLGDALAAA